MAVVAYSLPAVYRSEATILIEAQDIPANFVQTTVTSLIEERLQTITQIVTSRSNLLKIINEYDPYPDMAKKYTTEEIIEKMREDIAMQPIQADVQGGVATIAFVVSYEGKDPEVVSDVANNLVTLYLEANLDQRIGQAEKTYGFLEEELEKLRLEIEETEEKVAAFKEKNLKSLPDLRNLNLNTLEKINSDIKAQNLIIRSLMDRKQFLEKQLSFMDPTEDEDSRVVSLQERLEEARNQYVMAKSTHSAKHPDVIRLKNQVDAMEEVVRAKSDLSAKNVIYEGKRDELDLLKKRYSDNHPDVKKLTREVENLREEVEELVLKAEVEAKVVAEGAADNPLYRNTEIEIKETDIEISTAKRSLANLQAKYEEYLRRVEETPKVEQAYSSLLRDYETAQAKYQNTLARLQAAQEAKGMEERNLSERLVVIDPPVVPEKPFKPNRTAILAIGIVLAAGLGVGSGAAAEFLDQSIRVPAELSELSGHGILGVIPYLETKQEKIRRKNKRLFIIIGSVVFIVALILAVHFFYRPLDILMIDIQNKFKHLTP
jgi:uncharacterized protein involved in exopolysaccharide biosynthesis